MESKELEVSHWGIEDWRIGGLEDWRTGGVDPGRIYEMKQKYCLLTVL